MKKNLFLSLAVCLFSLFTFVSCETDDGLMVDWAPVTINIKVQDSLGNDLLDEADTARFIGKDIYAIFKGNTYKMDSVSLIERTDGLKDIAVNFEGLLYVPKDSINVNHMEFGPLDGSADMEEKITICWKDGSKDVITYHCSNHNEKKLTCNRWYKLNGVKTKNPVLIVK